MPLTELQRIKQWHLGHRHDHPLECQLWDAMLTLWVVGWVGLLPTYAFQQLWAVPVCVLSIAAPGLYAGWRSRAHRARKLRCDWAR
jgi:hypothetical protein